LDLVAVAIALAVIIAVTVVPVMVAAKWARARRNGFFAALAAVVLATLVAQAAMSLIEPPWLALAVAAVGGFLVYAWVLGTTFVTAIGVAVVALVLQIVITAGLVALGLEWPGATGIGVAI